MNRREEIYRKALGLFTERGYDATSVSQLADELGLSKGGLYHYFKSKEQLLFLIHEDYLKRHVIPILERAESIADPEQRITFFIENYTKCCILIL